MKNMPKRGAHKSRKMRKEMSSNVSQIGEQIGQYLVLFVAGQKHLFLRLESLVLCGGQVPQS